MDNQRQVVRSEETVVAGEPDQAVVNTQTSAPGYVPAQPVAPAPGYVAPVVPAAQTTVQTTETGAPYGDRVVAHNMAETVIDPAAQKAASINWVNSVIWFIVGIMVVLLAIRFVLLLTGANEAAGFAALIYGLTGWMVAPFHGVFGSHVTYPGAAQTGIFEYESLLAIVVYALIGWALTKILGLALGTNRTNSVAYTDTTRRTRI